MRAAYRTAMNAYDPAMNAYDTAMNVYRTVTTAIATAAAAIPVRGQIGLQAAAIATTADTPTTRDAV